MTINKNLIYEMQAEICQALSHPIRLHILDLIAEKERSSSELLEILQIPKANLSQHIAVLKDAGILKAHKEGAYQCLTLALPRIKDACSLVKNCLADRLNDQSKVMQEIQKNLNKKAK